MASLSCDFLRSARLCLALAVAVPAADFWLTSRFTEWTREDAEKILHDSPWARRVAVSPGIDNVSQARDGRTGDLRVNRVPDLALARLPVSLAKPGVALTLRWHSALAVRHALARINFGGEAGTSPLARRILQRVPDHYSIALAGLPPENLEVGSDKWKSAAELRRRGKEPVAPVEVQGELEQASQRAVIYFLFPKHGANQISLDDKEVEIVVKFPQAQIRRKFLLKDLIYEGKLEL